MIIVQMIGGIGNQLFQYALFRNLYERYDDVYYETFYSKPHHNGFELDKVFNIIEKPIEDFNTLKKLDHFQETTWPDFNPEVLNKNNTYFTGNWQNINYFPKNQNAIKKELTFKQKLDSKNSELLSQIQESNSVSLHVRRGDFLTDGLPHFWPTWLNYYGLAVQYMIKNASGHLKFFAFSDDIEWCKRNFMIPCTYVENPRSEGWKDMMLMSNCKHNIITKSTFSWWGAYLNSNPNKIVVTPKKWFMSATNSDLINLKEWIKI